jgi:hypothetical protein
MKSNINTLPGKPELGIVVTTAGAAEALSPDDIMSALRRHVAGHWGGICPDDREENERSLRKGFRLLWVYQDRSGTKLSIVTECDRSMTTVLLPDECCASATGGGWPAGVRSSPLYWPLSEDRSGVSVPGASGCLVQDLEEPLRVIAHRTDAGSLRAFVDMPAVAADPLDRAGPLECCAFLDLRSQSPVPRFVMGFDGRNTIE